MATARRPQRHRQIHPAAHVGRAVAVLPRPFRHPRPQPVSAATPLPTARQPAQRARLPIRRCTRQRRHRPSIEANRPTASGRARSRCRTRVAQHPLRRRTATPQPCPSLAASPRRIVSGRSHQPAGRRFRRRVDAHIAASPAGCLMHRYQPSGADSGAV